MVEFVEGGVGRYKEFVTVSWFPNVNMMMREIKHLSIFDENLLLLNTEYRHSKENVICNCNFVYSDNVVHKKDSWVAFYEILRNNCFS